MGQLRSLINRAVCKRRGHAWRHRFGFIPGNYECTRCWRRRFADGTEREVR